METYLGIDVGSVTTKFAVLDGDDGLITSLYLPTQGRPVVMVQEGLRQVGQKLPPDAKICGVATTGSARYLAGVIVGADLVKNEITSHAVAALQRIPDVQTIIEIGGQDSKVIIIRNGEVSDFGMNTVCAAGTGSFLDHQALRLNMDISKLGQRALESKNPTPIAGRCTVFAESDMVHKQQMGQNVPNILYGLCRALVRNYRNSVCCGKEIQPPIVFQGGVAFNQGMVRAFREELGNEIIIPPHHELMGAIGAALLAHEEIDRKGRPTGFRGFSASDIEFHTSSAECRICPQPCEISRLSAQGQILAYWGGRCDASQNPQLLPDTPAEKADSAAGGKR